MADLLAVGSSNDKRMLLCKIGGIQNREGVAAVKADPGIFPRVGHVRIVGDLLIGINQEGVACVKLIRFVFLFIIPAAGNDIVDQVMIPHARSPLVEGIAFLVADVIDGEGEQLFFRRLV